MPLPIGAPFWLHQPLVPRRRYQSVPTVSAYGMGIFGASMGRYPGSAGEVQVMPEEQPEEEHPWWNIVLEPSE